MAPEESGFLLLELFPISFRNYLLLELLSFYPFLLCLGPVLLCLGLGLGFPPLVLLCLEKGQ